MRLVTGILSRSALARHSFHSTTLRQSKTSICHHSRMGSKARMSLGSFLRSSKLEFVDAKKHGHKVTIVSGNQSADLDSMSSSILYAYFQSQSPPEGAFTDTYIPILNIPAKDIDLRPEFKLIFKLAGIDPKDIVTLSDLPSPDILEKELPPEKTRWLLTDHNKLEGDLGAIYGKRVHGVIDHHVEEHAVPKDTSPEPRIIEKCGSCSSLVINYFESIWNSSESIPEVDAKVAKLALGSIAIDTKNLLDEFKVEKADRKASDICNNRIIATGVPWNSTSFYEQLDTAKRDIESLPLQGILRKDYKEWTEGGLTLGMSSCVKPLDFLAQKAKQEKGTASPDPWNEEIDKFMRERDLDMHSVGTSYNVGDEHYRELCLQWRNKNASDAVQRFEQHAGEELGLAEKKIDGVDGGDRRVWQQNNVNASRKQVGPLIRKAMRGDSSL